VLRTPPPAVLTTPGQTVRHVSREEAGMSKRGRKRRGRKKNAANHGKRPNA